MEEAYLCDGIRTPVGRYGGSLSGIRADDLASIRTTCSTYGITLIGIKRWGWL